MATTTTSKSTPARPPALPGAPSRRGKKAAMSDAAVLALGKIIYEAFRYPPDAKSTCSRSRCRAASRNWEMDD